jgi:hypothetical protein
MKILRLFSSNKSTDFTVIFFVFLSCLLGGFVRVSQVLQNDAPINDGGLFYQMTVDLQDNNYRLPVYSSYNQLEIPYAYPPLSFYTIGIVSEITRIELFDLFRVLPAFISFLTIPVFYFLAREILENKAQNSLAVLIFALIPASYDWLIMGGGLTRSMGFLFSLLTLHQAVLLYQSKNKFCIPGVSIFAAITVLSHPEASIQTITGVLVLFWFYGRHRQGIIHSIITSISVLVLSSPWWLTVIMNHGLSPFLAAGQTSWHNLGIIYQVWKFNFTGEIGLTITGVLALVGLFFLLTKKEYLLPGWLIITFFIDPRSAPIYLTPILAMLAAITAENLLKLFNEAEILDNNQKNSANQNWAENLFAGKFSKLFFLFILTQWIYSAYFVPIYRTVNISLTSEDLSVFEWINKNIPTGSRIAIVTNLKPLTDPVSEWFPALTKSINVSTPQGHEWIPGTNFDEILQQYIDLQSCSNQEVTCLEDWEDSTGNKFEYFLIRKGSSLNQGVLEISLNKNTDYQLIHFTDMVSIYQKQ